MLYHAHSAAVYGSAMAVVANSAEAEEIVQEVFMRHWRDPDRFDPDRGTVGNYLRVMARSRALDVRREARVAWRAHERMKVLAHHHPARREDRPPVAAELHREHAILWSALTRLPEPQRQAIVMAYWG